jgi:hypothetical protein
MSTWKTSCPSRSFDNGRGISGDITGSGLVKLRERARDAGGSFAIEPAPSGGTVLRWSAPSPGRTFDFVHWDQRPWKRDKVSASVGVNRKPRPNMHGTLVDVKVIKDAVRLACRAPSLHNSQPWRLDRDGKRRAPLSGYQPNHAFHRPFGTGSDHQLRSAARPPPGCHGWRMSTDSLIQTISTIWHLSISRQ